MLKADKVHIVNEWDFSELEIENQGDEEGGYVTTEMLPISFENEKGEFVGDLLVYFVVSIVEDYGGKEVAIENYYHIPAFNEDSDREKGFLEDMEAFKFIALNFGDEVQEIIDEALEILYEKYEPESND